MYSGHLNSPCARQQPVELHPAEQWRSTYQHVTLLLRDDDDDDNKKKQVFEVWKDGMLEKHIELSPKLHGKVIGHPAWRDDQVVCYTAERAAIPTESFFATEMNEEAQRGQENTMGIGKQEHWGEQLFEQAPILDLFVLHLGTSRISRVENIPEDVTMEDPVFAPDGTSIVYTGWDAGLPRRLGRVYCQQRPSQLYSSPVTSLVESLSLPQSEEKDETEATDSKYESLTSDYRLARSPRFAPTGTDDKTTLVFLGSANGFDTHSGCMALYGVDWETKEIRSVVKEVQDPRDSSEDLGVVSGLTFPGLFMQSLPRQCFVSPTEMLVNSQWGSSSKVIHIDLDSCKASLFDCNCEEPSSQKLVCMNEKEQAIISTESSTSPAELLQVSLGKDGKATKLYSFKSIASSRYSSLTVNEATGIKCSIETHAPPSVDTVEFDLPIQSILLLPKDSKTPPPLIVVPHGGPHSVSSTNFLPSYAYLCQHGGYAILLVNYRGSTGFGQASVQSLPTNIGKLDVQDVMHATQIVCASGLVDKDRVGICGGSHGGFLTGHCTSQYPDFFRAAAMRNPVVNLPSMTTATDIPDWCFVEACGRYDWLTYRPPTSDELQQMRDVSPIARVANVQTPTLVALGLSDLRVPPSQGMEWFYTLRSQGVPTKLLTYDTDNHAIAEVQSEANHWIQIKQWFDKYL